MTENNPELVKIANDENEDNPDIIVKEIEKVMKDIKYKAFGKVKEKTKTKNCKELEMLMKEKNELFNEKESNGQNDTDDKLKEIDSKISLNLIKKQREAFEHELDSIRELKKNKGTSTAVFKIREKIVGSKSTKQEATVIIDPKTNIAVNTPDEIRRVSLQYCVDLLTNREPLDDFEEDIHWKNLIHQVRMEETIEDNIQWLTDDMLENTFSVLQKKPGAKYNFIMKGGTAAKAALYRLCKAVWKTENFPTIWEKSTLVQLYKSKGSRSVLDNMRHIHIKEENPKFFGHLVVSAAKEQMISSLTKYQIATNPGHRTQEHLFVLKSVIGLYMAFGKTIVVSMWDLSKFFDRENLIDCMNELYKCGVKGKLYRLLYALNKNTRICVQTPVGVTEEEDIGEGVGQGTLEGAIVSAVNLDKGVNEFFHDSEYEISYGEVTLQPILYQDDVARMSVDLESAQMGNNKMEAMAESKLLNYNLEKSCFLLVGKEAARNEMQQQLLNHPLTLCGQNMKQENSAKYLGDWISCLGLAGSVDATVKKRKGLATLAIFEIRAVIEDCRSEICGGLKAGIDIWELAVIPKLLFNSGTWMDISANTMQELEELQIKFYRCLLAVGSGCPIPSLYWETGGMLIKNRILKSKLLLLHHIATLAEDTLAREILEVQMELRLPGLYLECKEFLVNAGVTDLKKFTVAQWKKVVKTEVLAINRNDILNQMRKPYKKISLAEHTQEEFQLQPYMSSLSIAEARMKFKLKTGMTPTVRMNFPSDKEFARMIWTCPGCSDDKTVYEEVEGIRDTQAHILICPGYSELREDKDLSTDRDLVAYFRNVIQKRLKTDD